MNEKVVVGDREEYTVGTKINTLVRKEVLPNNSPKIKVAVINGTTFPIDISVYGKVTQSSFEWYKITYFVTNVCLSSSFPTWSIMCYAWVHISGLTHHNSNLVPL